MTMPIIFAGVMHYIFGILMTLTSVFLILLVLVQRGKGGGLAGAFGGMGGQSAFGTKAGDAFTKVTIGAATFWILLCIAAVKLLSAPAWTARGGAATNNNDPPAATADEEPGAGGMSSDAGEPSTETPAE